MRIYLAFFQTQSRGPGAANYDFWAGMLRAGLTEQGHTVLESPTIDWVKGMQICEDAELPPWREQSWSQVLVELAQHQANEGVDLFLGYFFPKQVEPAAVREINRRGIPTVNFFCDNVREFRRVPEAFHPFQLHWVPEWAAVPLYREAGLKFVHAPMPMWIPPEFRTLPEREDNIATFLGSHDVLRGNLFHDLAQHGGRLRIHGKGWVTIPGAPVYQAPPVSVAQRLRNQAHFIRRHGWRSLWRKLVVGRNLPRLQPPADWLGAPVPRDEYIRLSRESAVTVGVNRFDSPRLTVGEFGVYSRLRDIEAPMLGACYLTEWAPGLDQLFDLEREIATYRNAAELAAQIKALLADPTRRAAMRAASQRRALAEHTIGRTMDSITAALGLKPSSSRS